MVQNNKDASPLAEQVTAPVTEFRQETAPRQMRVERQGARSEPFTRRFPQVRGGTCEYCGVIDNRYPAQDQYKMCEHYKGMQLRCSYCADSKNPDEVIRSSGLNVAESPTNPGTLIVWCGSFECSAAHNKRFSVVNS